MRRAGCRPRRPGSRCCGRTRRPPGDGFGSGGPPTRTARESPITAPVNPVTAGPAGSGDTDDDPTRSVSEPTCCSPRTVPVYASPPAATQASAEAATAMAVMRAIAPLRWCQISATACGPASSPARLRARSTASMRRQPAPAAAARANTSRPSAAPEVPAQEAAGDVVDRLCLGLRAGQRVEHLRGRGVALDRAHGEARAQRAVDPQPGHVELGVADLHQLRRPGRASGWACGRRPTGAGRARRRPAPGVSATVTGTPTSRQNATSSTVGQARSSRSTPGRRGATGRAGSAWGDDLRTGHPPSDCMLDRFSVPGRGRPVTRPIS